MKCTIIILLHLFFLSTPTRSQLYNPAENASLALDRILVQSKKDGKHVFIQVGGNWCVWCTRFTEFFQRDSQIDSLMKNNYNVYHLNYSKENYNKKIMKKLEFPQRFGFPVFVILDSNGKRLHTQNSAYLEEGNTYSADKIKEFLINWCPEALQPSQYK